MEKLKFHPFESECDQLIVQLGGDLSTMKQTHDTGYLYNGGTSLGVDLYIALPLYTCSDLFRLEVSVGESDQKDIGRILFAITSDLDQRYFPLRVVPRTKDNQTYEIILQCISNTHLVQSGFITSVVFTALELGEFYRTEYLEDQKKTA